MKFWEIIESAWSVLSDLKCRRMELAKIKGEKEPGKFAKKLESAIRYQVYPELEKMLIEMPKGEFSVFVKSLKSKLISLDNNEIYKYINGSDDGYLYSRGFIIAMGEDYYDAVIADPSIATLGLESEEFGSGIQYLFDSLYHPDFTNPPPLLTKNSNVNDKIDNPETSGGGINSKLGLKTSGQKKKK